MDVEVVHWPTDASRLAALRHGGRPRLVVVEGDVDPPVTADVHEDWIRLPARPEDVRHRLSVLAEREDPAGLPAAASTPVLDRDGVLRLGDGWVALPPVEHRLTAALLERYRAVVSREALTRAGWPDGTPDRNVLDVHIVRLRRRLAPLDLVIATVRSRGYLLETGRAPAADD